MMRGWIAMAALVLSVVQARADGVWTSTETVRARFQTGTPDDSAPQLFAYPVRTGILEGNERFRLQEPDNRAALAADLSAYLQTSDHGYQLIPNELYADLAPHAYLGAQAGRKRLVYGAGFALNPMDWLNPPKDPLNPSDQRVGAYLALAEGHTADYALTFVYAPDVVSNAHGLPTDVTFDASVLLLRGYALVGEGDLNVQLGYDHQTPRAGLSYSTYFFDVYEGHIELSSRQGSTMRLVDPRVLGFLSAHPITDPSSPKARQMAANVTPFITPFADDDRWFTRVLVGSRYMFESGDMVTLEYFWNGEGLTNGQWDDRNSLLRKVPAAWLSRGTVTTDPTQKFNVMNQRKNYVAVTGAIKKFGNTGFLEDLGGNLAVMVNVDPDPCALVYPSLTLRRGDHATLAFGVAGPMGSPTSEFGSLPFREQYVFETSIFF